jgi:hypothetical protein
MCHKFGKPPSNVLKMDPILLKHPLKEPSNGFVLENEPTEKTGLQTL